MQKIIRYVLIAALLLVHISGYAAEIVVIAPETCATTTLVLNPALSCTPIIRPLTFPIVLKDCTVPTQTVTFAGFETAIPLRTTIVSHVSSGSFLPGGKLVSGCDPYRYADNTCLSSASLDDFRISLTYEGGTALFSFLEESLKTIRRKDGNAITSLSIEDAGSYEDQIEASKWFTFSPVFATNCSVTIVFYPNEPDVNSKDQALTLIAAIDQDLTSKTTERDLYQQLIVFSRAYDLIKSIADNFYNQLSNDTLQNLRVLFADNKDTLKALIMDSQGPYTQDQRVLLFNLYLSMFNLGNATDWQNPDGTTKTIEQYLGGDAADVFTAVMAIGDKVKAYDDFYNQAAHDVEALASKLALAKVQLAAWLK